MIQVNRQEAANTFYLSYNKMAPVGVFHRMKHAFWNKTDLGEKEISIILKRMLCEVISKKMKPPISIMISGGVDSTMMLLMALECFDATQIGLFTADYGPDHFGESSAARKLAHVLGIPVVVVAMDWDTVIETLNLVNKDTYREWFFSSSLVPTRGVMKRASEYSNNVLTGDGGDELFCGYDRTIICNKTRMLPAPVRWLLGRAVDFYPGKSDRYRKLKGIAENGYESTITVWPRVDVVDLIGQVPIIPYLLNEVMDMSIHYLEKLMLFDIGTELYGVEIPKVETAARMIGGNINVVSPFLDEDVMRFCCALPLKYKYQKGVRKVLLRKMIKDVLGDRYVPGHRKVGFRVPLGDWLRDVGDLSRAGLDYMFKDQGDWLNSEVVRRTFNEHLSGVDHTQRLWSIMMWRLLQDKGILERVE